jgi:transcriptional regulator
VGTLKQTAHRKWAAYLKANGREHIPPSKATQEDKAGFTAYLLGNSEEAQKKAMESEQARKQVAIEKATEALRGAIHVLVKHGVDVESLVKEVLADAE